MGVMSASRHRKYGTATNGNYPSCLRALRKIRIHGLSSPQFSGCGELATVRNTRSDAASQSSPDHFRSSPPNDAVRRTVRVSRMGFGHLTKVINVAQGDRGLCSQARQDAHRPHSTRPLPHEETAIGIVSLPFPCSSSDGLCVTSRRAEAGFEAVRMVTYKTATVRCPGSARADSTSSGNRLHAQRRVCEDGRNEFVAHPMVKQNGFRPAFTRPPARRRRKSRRKPPAHGSCPDRYDRPAGRSYGRQSRQTPPRWNAAASRESSPPARAVQRLSVVPVAMYGAAIYFDNNQTTKSFTLRPGSASSLSPCSPGSAHCGLSRRRCICGSFPSAERAA